MGNNKASAKSASKPVNNTKPANVPAAASKSVGAKGATATHLQAVKPKSADEDEEDEDEGAEGGKSHKALITTRVSNMQRKLKQVSGHCKDTTAVAELAAEALDSVSKLLSAIDTLPADWARARKVRVGAVDYKVGALVAVSDSFKTKYAGLIEEDEMDELRVVKKASMKNGNALYSVATPDGSKMFIAGAHLRSAE